MKALVVVDMQNDFITGKLGSKEAQALLPKVVECVKNFDGGVYYTKDIHHKTNLGVKEIEKFGFHCMLRSQGFDIPEELQMVLNDKNAKCYYKNTFMPAFEFDKQDLLTDLCGQRASEIYVIGVTTDICILNTALWIRNGLDRRNVIVLKDLCVGTSKELHEKALDVMKSNVIEIKESRDVING